MRVHRGFDDLPALDNAVATMGSFDGVHGGHRELLRRVKSLAASDGGRSVVLTFEPHPRYVLGSGGGMRLLSTLDEKLWLLGREGIDDVIVIPFTEQFSRLTPREFIERDITGIGIRRLVVGYNHRFGHNKQGDYDFLESRVGELEIHMVEQQQIADGKVSSTIIRQLVAVGMMDKARKLLSHPYIIMGRVASDGAVTDIDRHKLLPMAGSYDAVAGDLATRLHISEGGAVRLDIEGIEEDVIIEL